MTIAYIPKDYWEKRLSGGFDLSRVGYFGLSNFYNKFLYKAKIRTLKKALLLQHVEIHNKTVCDVGCGTGFFVDFYHLQKANYIVGVDITHVSIEFLKRKYPHYHFVKEDVSSSSLISKFNRKFDIINVFDVLYHITDDKAFGLAIANICKLTNDNGFIFISDSFGSKDINAAEHVKFRSRGIYQTTLEDNGVKIIAAYPLFYLLHRPILGMTKIKGLRKIGGILDNLFAPFYYYFDGIFFSNQSSSLSLIVARKVKP
ncbi:MAG: class I SAM-dependent methyltransferase [Thermodesulfobacteriota bacterium]